MLFAGGRHSQSLRLGAEARTARRPGRALPAGAFKPSTSSPPPDRPCRLCFLEPSLLVAGLLRSSLCRQHFPKSQTLFRRTGVPQASSHRIDHRRVELGPWSMTAAVLLSVMPFAVAAAAACAKIRGRVRFTTSSRQHNVTPKSFVTSLFKKV